MLALDASTNIHCNTRGTGGTRPPSVLVPVMTTTEAVVPARSLTLSGTLSIRTATGMRCAGPLEGRLDGGQQLESCAAVLPGDAPANAVDATLNSSA